MIPSDAQVTLALLRNLIVNAPQGRLHRGRGMILVPLISTDELLACLDAPPSALPPPLEIPRSTRQRCPRYPEMCGTDDCLSCYLEVLQQRVATLEHRLQQQPGDSS